MASSTPTIAVRGPAKYADAIALPVLWTEPHWYAAYTRAQHEKQVAAELETREVEHFLPLYSSMRRWKDRRVQLELDRKSTRLNSSHITISYAVFCLKKKKKQQPTRYNVIQDEILE